MPTWLAGENGRDWPYARFRPDGQDATEIGGMKADSTGAARQGAGVTAATRRRAMNGRRNTAHTERRADIECIEPESKQERPKSFRPNDTRTERRNHDARSIRHFRDAFREIVTARENDGENRDSRDLRCCGWRDRRGRTTSDGERRHIERTTHAAHQALPDRESAAVTGGVGAAGQRIGSGSGIALHDAAADPVTAVPRPSPGRPRAPPAGSPARCRRPAPCRGGRRPCRRPAARRS